MVPARRAHGSCLNGEFWPDGPNFLPGACGEQGLRGAPHRGKRRAREGPAPRSPNGLPGIAGSRAFGAPCPAPQRRRVPRRRWRAQVPWKAACAAPAGCRGGARMFGASTPFRLLDGAGPAMCPSRRPAPRLPGAQGGTGDWRGSRAAVACAPGAGVRCGRGRAAAGAGDPCQAPGAPAPRVHGQALSRWSLLWRGRGQPPQLSRQSPIAQACRAGAAGFLRQEARAGVEPMGS